jgi:hypothetical protein
VEGDTMTPHELVNELLDAKLIHVTGPYSCILEDIDKVEDFKTGLVAIRSKGGSIYLPADKVYEIQHLPDDKSFPTVKLR